MRFQIGSMVEVFSKKKDVLGVWRCAQVVEDNGDGYTVRYYRSPRVAKEGVDKVPSVVVRPRPPAISGSTIWAVGDVVEVLDDGCWRVCMIEEVIEDDDDHYGIQVIGSVDEFRVRKSGIRVRQEWKGNQWVIMDKDFGINKKLISRMHKMVHMQTQGDLNYVEEVPSKTRKRSPVDYQSTEKAFPECVKKRRTVTKEVKCYVVHDAYSFNGKGQVSGSLKKTQGKHKVQNLKETPRINKTSYRNHDDAHRLGRTSEHECASSRSSVASCSIGDACLDRLASHCSASCNQGSDSLCSDAESFDQKGGDEAMSAGQSKQNDTLRLHEQELNSYRSTLEALYACGPLSWELETYLTNLRQKYSVSNDEHLKEIRRLTSSRGLGLSCY